jgi:hypothetical protein
MSGDDKCKANIADGSALFIHGILASLATEVDHFAAGFRAQNDSQLTEAGRVGYQAARTAERAWAHRDDIQRMLASGQALKFDALPAYVRKHIGVDQTQLNADKPVPAKPSTLFCSRSAQASDGA